MGRTAAEIEAARAPHVVYGHDILRGIAAGLGRFAVITMAEPWQLAREQLGGAAALHMVTSMDRAAVEHAEAVLPAVDAVMGLGGGSAMDMAKYIAWRRGARLVLAPTIVSVDAAVTNTIGVRDEGHVRYIGFVLADTVAVDFRVIAQAPPALNRAGIGDILSIHTGCWDWKLADRRAGMPYDPQIAARALALVDSLEQRAAEVRALGDDALRFIMESYVAENDLCLQAGTSQPEEGSEHFWAYNLEYRTGRHFVHGELICLGVLLMARLQDNEPERVRAIVECAGVRYHPVDLGITREDMRSSLRTLRAYVESERLTRSVIDERPIDESVVERLIDGLLF